MRVTPVTDDPAAGGLSREITDYEYNDVGLPTETSGASGYLLATSYSALGQAEQLTLGTSAAAGTKKAYIINRFDEGTDRLINSHVTDDIHGYMPRDLTYAYDDVGNLAAIKGPATLGGTGKADYQCFVYDGYRRLTARTVPSRCAFHAAGGRQCLDSRSRVVDLALRDAEVQPPRYSSAHNGKEHHDCLVARSYGDGIREAVREISSAMVRQ